MSEELRPQNVKKPKREERSLRLVPSLPHFDDRRWWDMQLGVRLLRRTTKV